jgi:hypothetical protein
MRTHDAFRRLCLLLLVCAAGFVLSCRPTVDLPVISNTDGYYHIEVNTFTDLFIAVWQAFNVNYVYWDIERDGLWDDVRDAYEPKFDALGAWDPSRYPQAVEYFKEMADFLHDGHLTLISANNYSPQDARVDGRFPGGFEDDANPKSILSKWNNWSNAEYDGHPRYIKWDFLGYLILEKYLDYDSTHASNYLNGTMFVVRGEIPAAGGYLVYFFIDAFALQAALDSEKNQDEALRSITRQMAAFWEQVSEDDCKGVIFDLRGNMGGAAKDIPYLLAPFLEADLHFGYTRSKKGEGRLNYGPWTPWVLKAASAADRIPHAGNIPVVALVNDYSISCGEIMPLAVKAMPKGFVIGTRTYGATGPGVGDMNPAALRDGSFTVVWDGGSIIVKQAGWQLRGPRFENYEGVGITPDMTVPFNWKDFTNNGVYNAGGKDAQLEAAIDYVEEQQ